MNQLCEDIYLLFSFLVINRESFIAAKILFLLDTDGRTGRQVAGKDYVRKTPREYMLDCAMR